MQTSVTFRRQFAALLLTLLTACSATYAAPAPTPTDQDDSLRTREAALIQTPPVNTCQVTEPAWLKPPDDPAVQGEPEFEYFFVNQDRSIWASAWWTGEEEQYLNASKEGIKVGWFRPEGAPLEVTGRRIDGEAPPLEAEVPCCYSTRFQASGLYFPTGGCWEVTAKAAGSELSFVVWVEP